MEVEKKNSRQMDMLEGGIFKKLCTMAIPIFLTSTLQQLFNATGMAIAGRFSSSNAMAAVGSNAPVINIVVTLFTGLSIGSNVMLAGFIGAGKKDKAHDALHTSFTVALISGFIMLGIGLLIAKPVLSLLSTPSAIMKQATHYLQIYFLGMPFVMIYDFSSAVFRAVGDTRRPLNCLLVSGIVNVILSYFFVAILHMDASGTALATTLANGVSALLIFRLLVKEKGTLHLDIRKLSLKKEYLIPIFTVGAPAGLQGMIFSLSNIVIQDAINHFGADCVAGNSAGLNFEYICYFIVNGFAQATVTFVSQNYAARKYDRCRKTTRIAMTCAIGFTAILSVIFFTFRYQLVGTIFSSNPQVIKYAAIRMTFITLFEGLTATYEITGGSLRGIGHSLGPALLTLFGSCILRVVYISVMLPHFTDFGQVAVIYPITWIVTGTMVTLLYFNVTKKAYRHTSRININN